LDDGKNFPLFTKKFVNFNAIVKELLWFLSGSNNINDLDSSIWNQWSNEEGSIGEMYSAHFRNIDGEDPYMDIVKQIKEDPYSRRHCITTWRHSFLPLKGIPLTENAKLGRGNLACCWGTVIQWYVNSDGELDASTYQRSCDTFLGGFFNIPQQALLLMITAKLTGYKAGTLFYDIGNAHIYKNHINQVKEYLTRPFLHKSPSVVINECDGIPTFDDIHLLNYQHQSKIKAPIAV
jgi:thymidylate synthase